MVVDWLESMNPGAWVALAAVLVAALAAVGLGSVVAAALGLRFASSTDRLAGAFSLGLAAVALGVLLVGSVGWLGPTVVWVLGVAAAGLGVWRERASFVGLLHAARAEPAFTLTLAVTAAFYFGSTALYPAGWDALTYQVAVPYRWTAAGHPAVLGDLPYSGFPSLPQLVLWPLTMVGGITTPRLWQWLLYVVVFATLYGEVRRFASRWLGIAMTLAYAFAPVSLIMVKDIYAEPYLVLAIVGAFACSRAEATPRARAMAVGVLAGSAVAVKLTGLAVAFTCLLLLWVNRRRAWTAAAWCVVAAVATALPFYLRPWIATGNPLHPYFADWFGGSGGVLAMSKFHHAMGEDYGVGGIAGVFQVPILIAYHVDVIFDRVTVGWQFVLALVGTIGGAVVWVRRRVFDGAAACAIGGVAMYAFWHVTAQQPRFLLPMFFVALVATAGVVGPGARALRGSVAAAFVLTAVLSFVTRFDLAGHYVAAWQPVWRENVRRPLQAVAGKGYVGAIRALLDRTPADARILLMFERRGLYIPREHEIGTPYFQAARFTPTPPDPLDVHARLVADGFDYLLFSVDAANPDRVPAFSARQQPIKDALGALAQAGRIETVWREGGYRLVRIKE